MLNLEAQKETTGLDRVNWTLQTHLHGSSTFQNWDCDWSLFPEGFVASVGAPFDSSELGISVNVDDISESIPQNNLQTEFHCTVSVYGHTRHHRTIKQSTGTLSTRAQPPPFSVTPRLYGSPTNTATWPTTLTQPLNRISRLPYTKHERIIHTRSIHTRTSPQK